MPHHHEDGRVQLVEAHRQHGGCILDGTTTAVNVAREPVLL